MKPGWGTAVPRQLLGHAGDVLSGAALSHWEHGSTQWCRTSPRTAHLQHSSLPKKKTKKPTSTTRLVINKAATDPGD